jgi:hypothetical protein
MSVIIQLYHTGLLDRLPPENWPNVSVKIYNKTFWEEVITYFLMIGHGLRRKRRLQQFFVSAGTSLWSCYPATMREIHRQTHRLSFDTTRTADKMICPTMLLLLRLFLAAATFLTSRCLAWKWGINLTETLPCNDRWGYTYRHTDWWEEYMVNTADMGSVARYT